MDISSDFRTVNGYEYNQKGFKSGIWADTQKRTYSGRVKGNLTDRQLKLFSEIEFIWFRRKNMKYQTELITLENKIRKQIEIYNRFRPYLIKFSNNEDMISREEINQGFIDELDGGYVKK